MGKIFQPEFIGCLLIVKKKRKKTEVFHLSVDSCSRVSQRGKTHYSYTKKTPNKQTYGFLAAMSAFHNEGMAMYKKEILIIILVDDKN